MRLSILIPVFDAADYLRELLTSVRAIPIAATDLEVIVIDDGSRDHSADVVKAFAMQDVRIKFLQQANCGVAETRNRLLQAATGKYVWFVDADDVLVPEVVPLLMEMTTNDVDIITFNGVRFGTGLEEQAIYAAHKEPQNMTGEAWVCKLLNQRELRHFAWLHWCRRAYLADIALVFRSGILHEDVAWVSEVALRAASVIYIDKAAYRYRQNENSATGSRDDVRVLHRIRSYFTVVNQLRELNERVRMLPATRRLLRGEIVGQAMQVFELKRTLASENNRRAISIECRTRKFAQSLWNEAVGYKRKRQVLSMIVRQWLD